MSFALKFSTVLLYGDSKCGKSTLLSRALDCKLSNCECLEYTFHRKQQICNIWELSTWQKSLLDIPQPTGSFLITNLEVPDPIAVETMIQDYLKSNSAPFTIIGTKFDTFRSYPADLRVLYSKMLRAFAQKYNSCLLFTSIRDDITNFKALFSHYAYNSPMPLKDLFKDECMEDILEKKFSSFDQLKAICTLKFPPQETHNPINYEDEKYAEPIIDNIMDID